MWASYLGPMPIVWYPGQLKQRLYLENNEAEIELAESAPLILSGRIKTGQLWAVKTGQS